MRESGLRGGTSFMLEVRSAPHLPAQRFLDEITCKIRDLREITDIGRRSFRVALIDDGDFIDRGADAVVVLSSRCPEQIFPPDPSRHPVRLRLPLTAVSLAVATDYLAHHLVRMGHEAAHPKFFRPEDQARARLVADSRPSRPASMSKVTA